MSLKLLQRSFALCLAMAGLSACGNDQNQGGFGAALKEAGSSLSGSISNKKKPVSGNIGLTRAALANIVTPVDLVTIESRNAQGVIAKIATNRGVETWSSVDKKTIAMRDGVIVATRGLGEDLMSASVPQLAQLQNGSLGHNRVHTVLDGEDKPVYQRFDCNAIRGGAETIVIVELAYATHHVTEACNGPSGRFTNDYWFQTGGKLRKSRQWISDSVGYVVIEHLQ